MRMRPPRAAVAAAPLAALLAASLAGVPQASAAASGGEVSATVNAFTYRAASKPGTDVFFTARLSQNDSGGYDLSVTPEALSFTGNCALPAPVEQAQVYVCSTPGTPTTDLVGSKRGKDYIDLSATANLGKAPFVAPATISTGAGPDTILTTGIVAKVKAGKGADLINTEVTRGSITPLSTPGGDVHGGKGNDTVSYVAALDVPLQVSLDNRANDGRPGEKDNTHSDVENLTGPKTGFTAIGSAAANILTGGSQGDDYLVGRGGRDKLIGKNGNDRLDARDGRGGDLVNCGGGRDRVWLDRGDDMVNAKTCERVNYAR